MAFATGLRTTRASAITDTSVSGSGLDDFFAAVIDATEEAVLSSMFAAPTVIGRDGNTVHGLPVETVVELLRQRGRLRL